MSFTRAAVTAFRAAQRTAGARTQLLRQSARRGYSSAHGHEVQQSSDLPWAIGGAAVTIPACWYLLQGTPEEDLHLHVPHKIEAHKPEPETGAAEAAAAEPEITEIAPAAAAPAEVAPTEFIGELTTQTTKQEGLSNADTRYSSSRDEGSGLSHKTEGTLDSSKSKGTVDVHRQPEDVKSESQESQEIKESSEDN